MFDIQLLMFGINAAVPAVGVGGVTCFTGSQMVLMADGTTKPISEVTIGDKVKGRWGINEVMGYDRPKLGNRLMYDLNGHCLNTADHLTWTQGGWAVVNRRDYVRGDYQQEIEIETANGKEVRTYEGVDPEDVAEFVVEETVLGSMDGFEPLMSCKSVRLDPDTQLYALVLDGDRTFYVDGLCFSGWANDKAYDYKARIGT